MSSFDRSRRAGMPQLATIWVAALLLGVASATMAAPAANPEAAAEAAAATWLALVDAGKYGRSWTEAATYVRQTVEQSSWALSVARARAVCGPLQSRHLESAYATAYLPDSPDGHYVVIHYASRFARKIDATETITMVAESSGHWRVIGYYIN